MDKRKAKLKYCVAGVNNDGPTFVNALKGNLSPTFEVVA